MPLFSLFPRQTPNPPPSTPSIGRVCAITLQPDTIATIFGANEDASIAEDVALVELLDKNMTVEKSVTLEGKKDRPYHVVGEQNKFAVTWGPFKEQKNIQVALYTPKSAIDPIDTIQELADDQSRTKITLISVHHPDNNNNLTLRTVVNITCMNVKG